MKTLKSMTNHSALKYFKLKKLNDQSIPTYLQCQNRPIEIYHALFRVHRTSEHVGVIKLLTGN